MLEGLDQFCGNGTSLALRYSSSKAYLFTDFSNTGPSNAIDELANVFSGVSSWPEGSNLCGVSGVG